MPLIERPRSATTALAPFTITPFVNAPRMPPNVPVQSRVIDLVMVTAPMPPGSRQLISPPTAVLEIAPAKVLHGAVRLHGLASSPTPETQVRVAWACAGAAQISPMTAAAAIAASVDSLSMSYSPAVAERVLCILRQSERTS